jgi:protein involved in polysaccharide export with SLBB domain
MKKRHFAFLVLFVLAASPSYSSQSQSGGVQQSSSPNCADTLLASTDECAQSETSSPGEASGFAPPAPQGRTALGASDEALRGAGGAPHPQERSSPPDSPSEFQNFVAATTGELLPIYGVNLFINVPSTFSPSDLAPVTPEYVIGPEDELRVRIWGQITFSGNLRVDRSGDIYLPEVGIVHVAGLQFSALDQHLRQAIGRTYRNFDLSVDIGQIRSMQIYVTGEARRPGAYTVSSLSSLIDALFASGGPSSQGSLRHILLNRDGKTVANFDLYALLIHGDKSKDIRLLPEDVLYIPPAGPQVAVTGSIRNPAIYELIANETIGDLIESAGKITAMSSSARISLERVGQDRHRQAMEFGFDPQGLATPLFDGDIVRIYPILPAYEKTVTLRGDVANPGRFSWRPGMRLSDLIPDKDSLMSRDYWWRRSHLGLPVPEFESAALTPNTQQDMPSAEPTPAGQTGNTGAIASQLAQTSAPYGAGQAGRTELRLSTPELNWDYAVIERVDPESLRTSLISFDLGKLVIDHDARQDLPLMAGDTVTIFSQADIRVSLAQQTKYVALEGEFVHSGIYSVRPGESLRDLVRRAGGLTEKAYLYGAEFTRESTRLLQQQRIDEYVRTVGDNAERNAQALAASASSPSGAAASRMATQDLTARLSQIRATGRIVLEFRADASDINDVPALSLENGDRLVVPFVPATVNVVGAVNDQNSFLYQHGRSVGHYLELAGGPNRNADWRHSFVIRADGSVVSGPGGNRLSLWSSNSFKQLRLNPGDTIVVPDKTFRPSALRGFSDWTQIFSQLALGAAAINVL